MKKNMFRYKGVQPDSTRSSRHVQIFLFSFIFPCLLRHFGIQVGSCTTSFSITFYY